MAFSTFDNLDAPASASRCAPTWMFRCVTARSATDPHPTLPSTIKELSKKTAKVVICSHFDRPKGKRVPEMSLAPMAAAVGAPQPQR
jgi:hypothetical protein